MKLTKEHKNILNEMGYPESDFKQIEEATTKTTYSLYIGEYFQNRVGLKKAIELLGIKDFLSGIARSAFHWSACREVDNEQYILFDSSELFR